MKRARNNRMEGEQRKSGGFVFGFSALSNFPTRLTSYGLTLPINFRAFSLFRPKFVARSLFGNGLIGAWLVFCPGRRRVLPVGVTRDNSDYDVHKSPLPPLPPVATRQRTADSKRDAHPMQPFFAIQWPPEYQQWVALFAKKLRRGAGKGGKAKGPYN